MKTKRQNDLYDHDDGLELEAGDMGGGPNDRILAPPSSDVTHLGPITAREKSILQYFASVWMPSDTRKTGHQLTGFSPVGSEDGHLCNSIISGAMQSKDKTALNSLLAVVAQRIRLLNHAPLDPVNSPEYFSLRAVRSLRETFSSTQLPAARVVLDISYLILAELYRPPPARSTLYRSMNRDLIIAFGGLPNIDPFIGQAALAYEYFTAQSELSIPILNPLRDCRLLGISDDVLEGETVPLAAKVTSKLSFRVRILVEELNYLAQLAEALQQFPLSVVHNIWSFARHSTVQHHQLNAAALQQRGKAVNLESVTMQSTVMSADGLWMHLRQQAHRVWLWHSTLSFHNPGGWSPDMKPIVSPDFIERDASKFPEILTRIDSMLVETGWMMRKDVEMWIACLGYLVATTHNVLTSCARWMLKIADDLSIDSENVFRKALVIHLPFTEIRPDAIQYLWLVIRDGRHFLEL